VFLGLLHNAYGAAAAAFAQQEESILACAKASQPSTATATTLLEFLRNYLNSVNSPIDISIIGHSKSGALAPALAL
jgi:hypothetical protein